MGPGHRRVGTARRQRQRRQCKQKPRRRLRRRRPPLRPQLDRRPCRWLYQFVPQHRQPVELSQINDTGYLAGYVGANFGPWNLRGAVAGSFSFLGANRSIIFPGFADSAASQYDATTAQVFGEVGYSIAFGPIATELFAGRERSQGTQGARRFAACRPLCDYCSKSKRSHRSWGEYILGEQLQSLPPQCWTDVIWRNDSRTKDMWSSQ